MTVNWVVAVVQTPVLRASLGRIDAAADVQVEIRHGGSSSLGTRTRSGSAPLSSYIKRYGKSFRVSPFFRPFSVRSGLWQRPSPGLAGPRCPRGCRRRVDAAYDSAVRQPRCRPRPLAPSSYVPRVCRWRRSPPLWGQSRCRRRPVRAAGRRRASNTYSLAGTANTPPNSRLLYALAATSGGEMPRNVPAVGAGRPERPFPFVRLCSCRMAA